MKIAKSNCPKCNAPFVVKVFPGGLRATCPKCRKELILEEKYRKQFMKFNYAWIASIVVVLAFCFKIDFSNVGLIVGALFVEVIIIPRIINSFLVNKDYYHYRVDETKKDWKYDGEGNYYNEDGERIDFLHPNLTYQTIERFMTKELMADGGIAIDVRSKEEYQKGHIATSRNVPFDHLEQFASIEMESKYLFYIIYGETKEQSYEAAKKLEAMGYAHICDLGSIDKWDEPLEM